MHISHTLIYHHHKHTGGTSFQNAGANCTLTRIE